MLESNQSVHGFLTLKYYDKAIFSWTERMNYTNFKSTPQILTPRISVLYGEVTISSQGIICGAM